MKGLLRIFSCLFLLPCLWVAACSVPQSHVMAYKRVEVSGKPRFKPSGISTRMSLEEASRSMCSEIWWNDDPLNHRRVDASQRYKFEILEGSVVDINGTRHESSEVWRMYAGDRLIYDASICRVHRRVMERASRKGGISAEDLPRSFDMQKVRRFPNSAFEHDACGGLTVYTGLDWVCAQCSEAETKWLGKFKPKPWNREASVKSP